MVKYCRFCGKKYESEYKRQKYCSATCRKKARYKSNFPDYQKPKKLCNRKDCLYYNDYPNHCDYNYLTGELRGCKGGDSCTRYKKATESERKKYRNKMLREDEQGRNRSITVSYYYEKSLQNDFYRKYSKLIDEN